MSSSSIWPIDKNLSGSTTPSQRESGSNCNEGVLYIPLKLQGWIIAIRLFNVISKTLVGGVLHLSRNPVGVFYSPNRQGSDNLEKKIDMFYYLNSVIRMNL